GCPRGRYCRWVRQGTVRTIAESLAREKMLIQLHELEAQRGDGIAKLGVDEKPWLENLRPIVGTRDELDGKYRVASKDVLDCVVAPGVRRNAGLYRRLSRAMKTLGWIPIKRV